MKGVLAPPFFFLSALSLSLATRGPFFPSEAVRGFRGKLIWVGVSSSSHFSFQLLLASRHCSLPSPWLGHLSRPRRKERGERGRLLVQPTHTIQFQLFCRLASCTRLSPEKERDAEINRESNTPIIPKLPQRLCEGLAKSTEIWRPSGKAARKIRENCFRPRSNDSLCVRDRDGERTARKKVETGLLPPL